MTIPIHLARPIPIQRDRVAVETLYRGTRFRSRLEARWAAMFDLLRWPWSYEPIDLSGYIPDFVVTFDRGPLLVEVKPALYPAELEPLARKITLSGWTQDFLVVGAKPLRPKKSQQPSFGLLGLIDREAPPDDAGWLPAGHGVAIRCRACGISLRHYTDAWFCLSCGARDRRDIEDAGAEEIDLLWADAGNRVAWRARR